MSTEELMLLNCAIREDSWESNPWTTRRSNQSILKEISPGISLEGVMLKLKLQYFGHLMWRVDSLEKTLMLGGIGGRRRRGGQRMRWLMASLTRWMWVWVKYRSWWWTGRPGVLQFMGSQRVEHNWATKLKWNFIQALMQVIMAYFWVHSWKILLYLFLFYKSMQPLALFRLSSGFGSHSSEQMDTRTLEIMKARDHSDLRVVNWVLPLVFMSGG